MKEKILGLVNALSTQPNWDFLDDTQRVTLENLCTAKEIEEVIDSNIEEIISLLEDFQKNKQRNFSPELTQLLKKLDKVETSFAIDVDYI